MTLIAIILIAFFVGFGGGWGVKNWKDGAKIALIKSEKRALTDRNAILETANSNCAADIEGVKSAVGVITQGVEEREKAASAAMRDAETVVAKHKAAVAAIKALPPVPAEPEAQCKAIIEEQREYVQTRRSE